MLVIFLAFSDSQNDEEPFLRNISKENQEIYNALTENGHEELWKVIPQSAASPENIFNVFRDNADQVSIFHFAGHANGYELLLSGSEGAGKFYGDGFASFLAEQSNLKLVFLNGCATRDHVNALLNAGVSAVIATSRIIDDAVAKEFAVNFYRSLAAGRNLRQAFNEAQAAVIAVKGGDTRQLFHSDDKFSSADTFPWELHPNYNMPDSVSDWNLFAAAGDPLSVLPPLPQMDLPSIPYQHINRFEYKHAPIFFGRGNEVAELYRSISDQHAEPIILYYGLSGVGKSSLLDAGLRPRLERDYAIVYIRRDSHLGLVKTLLQGVDASADTLRKAWEGRESQQDKPLLVILDQVEECFTQPCPGYKTGEDELAALRKVLLDVFKVRNRRPRGKLLLSFREEYEARIETQFDAEELPFISRRLNVLSLFGIQEAIEGVSGVINGRPLSNSERLQDKYRLSVTAEAVELIKNTVNGDDQSVRAPLLQILLRKMWDALPSKGDRELTEQIADQVIKGGEKLQDVIEEQMRQVERDCPQEVKSGLLLDLLYAHITETRTSRSLSSDQIKMLYGSKLEPINKLIKSCKTHYLLSSPVSDEGEEDEDEDEDEEIQKTRLSHDVFGPIVGKMFDKSGKDGQRARQILELKTKSWEQKPYETYIDEVDLGRVEQGEVGMRDWSTGPNHPEFELLQYSKDKRKNKNNWRKVICVAGLLLVIGITYFGYDNSKKKEESDKQLISNYLQQARNELTIHNEIKSMHFSALGSAISENLSVSKRSRVFSELLAKKNSRLINLFHHTGSNLISHSNGTQFLIRDHGYLFQLWDLDRQMQVGINMVHEGGKVEFNQNGTKIVTFGDDVLRLWDIKTQEIIGKDMPHYNIRTVLFNHAGTLLLSLSHNDDILKLWDVSTQELVGEKISHKLLNGAVFSPLGKHILTFGGDGVLRLWNSATQDQEGLDMTSSSSVRDAMFNSSGTQALSWGSDDVIRLWDMATQKRIGFDMSHQGVRGARFNSSGTQVLSWGRDDVIRLWDVETQKQIRLYMPHQGVMGAMFNSSGKQVLSWGRDEMMRVWNIKSKELVSFMSHKSLNSALFYQDETKIVSWSLDGVVRLWEIAEEKKKVTKISYELIEDSLFSQSEMKFLDLNEDNIKIFDVRKQEYLKKRMFHKKLSGARFNQTGDKILSWGQEEYIKLWDVENQKQKGDDMQHVGMEDAFFNSTGTLLLSWGFNADNIKLWNVNTQKQTDSIEQEQITGAIFYKTENQFLFWGGWLEGSLRLWDIESKEQIGEDMIHVKVTGADLNHSETRIVSWGEDNYIRVWDATRQIEMGDRMMHKEVMGVSFNSNGSRILSWGGGAIRLWDVLSQEQIGATMLFDSTISDAKFSPREKYIISWSKFSGEIYIWDIESQEQLGFTFESRRVSSALINETEDQVLSISWDTQDIIRSWDFSINSNISNKKWPCFVQLYTGTKIGNRVELESLSPIEWSALKTAIETNSKDLLGKHCVY